VKNVFQGQISFSEGFSDLAGIPTLTVGAPIYQDKQVVGALLLNDAVSGIHQAAAQGQTILLYSAGAALLVSTLLSAVLSLSFTRPISRIKATARRLSDGDYSARTGLVRQDEIGQLALSIDILSGRLKEAQEKSQRQEQLRRDFLANVSHELRTPVAVLKSSLEAIQDGIVTDPAMIREYVHQMLKETEGLHRLVNDLMELARLQNADFPIENAPVSLQDVLLDALRSAERLAQAKEISIKRQFNGVPGQMQGDYARLKQMLLIVLDNAVKFSPNGSNIKVAMDEQSIMIQDEGFGIPSEDLPFIFDRFHKSRSEENRQGSGLGLAIARGIAERHSVKITVDSLEGKGTTVRFHWEQSDFLQS
jgi:signal transduction histidine kinase